MQESVFEVIWAALLPSLARLRATRSLHYRKWGDDLKSSVFDHDGWAWLRSGLAFLHRFKPSDMHNSF
jgi:hypothetical protein